MSMFTVKSGKIFDGALEIQLRGISHFGFNGSALIPMGMWNQEWKAQLAHIVKLGFNAVRVPFTPETLYLPKGATDAQGQTSSIGTNADLVGKTPLQVLDMWLAEADRLGLYILMDFHSPTNKSQYQTWFCDDKSLTYDGQVYTAGSWMRDLAFVAKRYAHLPLFMGIDLMNEPHGVVRWDVGDANYDNTQPHVYWRPAAESAAAVVLAANPNLLVFVQGTESNWNAHEKPNIPINYAENFQSQTHQPLNIPANKLVLSPHTYGHDTYVKSSFSAPNYPANLAADFETLFGQFYPKFAVVVGEWGGDSFGPTKLWQETFVDYLISKGMTSTFYWSYYGSGDTGDIVNDDLSINEGNMAILRRLWAATPPPQTPIIQPIPPVIPQPTPPPPVPPVTEWTPETLCMVVDRGTGVNLKFAATGREVFGTREEADAYIKKNRIGKEARTIIEKVDALVYKK